VTDCIIKILLAHQSLGLLEMFLR